MSAVTVRELRAEAKKLKIKGYSRMKKADLALAVAKAKSNAEPTDFKPADADVQTIGGGSLSDAAKYIASLNAANGGRKGASRKFRKMLRAAGFPAHAAVHAQIDDCTAKAA